jgi:hypothetical protein
VLSAGTAFGVLLLAQSAAATGISDSEPVFETVVVAPEPPSHDGGFSVGGRAAAILPGAGNDPGRAVENAPGVGRLVPTSDGLVLWGAAPQESRILWDGVELPALFHFGGWRSLVPMGAIARVSVLPGAFGADLGRALGGIVAVESAAVPSDRIHGWVAADPLDTSIGASGPIGERVGFLVAGRLGYLDRLASLLSSSQSRALLPLPAYRDVVAKATVVAGPRQTVTVGLLGAEDSRRLALRTSSPVDVLSEERSRSVARVVLRFVELGEGSKITALLWAGRDSTELAQQLGLVPVAARSRTWVAGARLARAALLGEQKVELGLDGLISVSDWERTGSLGHPPREGDITVFGATPGGAMGSDSWRPVLGSVAPYLLAELRWRSIELRPGLRLEGQLVSSDRTLPPTGLSPRTGFSRTAWSVEPRLGASVAVRSWLTLGAAAGVHHQLPDGADLSPVFGSPALGPSRARSGAISAVASGRRANLEAALFARRLDDLATRNPDPQPALAKSLVQTGRGRSYGAQLTARRDCSAGGICALLSYTLSRSERRGPGDAGWRLFDFDQTHVLTVALGYRGRRWSAATRLRYASGMPRTEVAGSTFDTSAGVYRPILGPHNATRLPAFVELDLRAERSWHYRRASLTASLEVVNATDRTNAEEIVYSGDYTRHAFVAGLPLLALAGLRLDM